MTRPRFAWVMALALSGFMLLPACEESKPAPETAEERQERLLKRGQYLTTIMDCQICHSPKMMTDKGPVADPSKAYMGHPAGKTHNVDPALSAPGAYVVANQDFTAYAGPWGVSYAANITPHETGIGSWDLAQFRRAMQEGKYHGMEGGRMLMPPMPWPEFAHLTEDDLESLFLYLKHKVKPLENVPPAYTPPAHAGGPPA